MARKDKTQRRIDQRYGALSGSNFLIEDAEAAPELEVGAAELAAPTDLTVSGTTLAFSAYTPTATVTLVWDVVYDRQIDGFVIEWALDSGFTNPVARTIAGNLSSAAIDSLPTDTTIYFRVASRFSYSQSDWSTAVNTTTALDTVAPGAPTGLLYNWNSRNGDLTLAWTNPTSSNAAYVRLRIYASNGGALLRDVQSVAARYVWTRAQQESDTSGAYDPSVYLVLTTFSTSGTASATDLTGTITAPTPSAVTASATSAFSAFTITAVATSADLLADYRYRIYKDSVLTATIYSASNILTYTATASGSYQCDVTARDAINQLGTPSSLTTALVLQSEEDFVTQLRAGLFYTDSDSNTEATLAALKDAVLTTGGVTYLSGAWNWTLGDWGREIRHETTTIATAASASFYIGTSLDNSAWTWHYGGTPSGGVWTPTLTTSTEATAQAGAVTIAAGTTVIRLSLPVQTRYIKLGHYVFAPSVLILREFYPRVLVQADDIVVDNLSAISANLGSITAGTVTGATIRTAATGQRVELTSANGLRGIDSSNVTQVQISPSDGVLTAGNGGAKVDSQGLKLYSSSDGVGQVMWPAPPGYTLNSNTWGNNYANVWAYFGPSFSPPENGVGITAEGDDVNDVGANVSILANASLNGEVAPRISLESAKFVGPGYTTGFISFRAPEADFTATDLLLIDPGTISREAVTAPTYTNGWSTDSGSPGYYKSADSIVRLRGRVAPGTNNTSAFTLPTGYRPPGISHRFPCIARNTAGAYSIAEVTIGTGGTVTINWVGTGTLATVDLSSIQFRA